MALVTALRVLAKGLEHNQRGAGIWLLYLALYALRSKLCGAAGSLPYTFLWGRRCHKAGQMPCLFKTIAVPLSSAKAHSGKSSRTSPH